MEKLTLEQIKNTKKAISETDAIMRLEGFEKNARSYAIDEAVFAGRITYDSAVKEMCAWVAEHKSLEGFDESREWLKPLEFNAEDALDMSKDLQTS